MTPGARLATVLAAVAWAGLLADGAVAQLAQLDESGSTVLLAAERRDGEPEHGAGVLLCQKLGKAYILTARHVIAGRHREEQGVPPLPGTYEIEISFSTDVGIPPLVLTSEGSRTKPFLQPSKEHRRYDVLLLEVPFAEREVPTAVVGRPPAGDELGRARRVTILGSGGAGTWLEREGTIEDRDDVYLYHLPALERGFSGGPVLDAEGEVIGIYTGTVKGEEIDADPGVDYGRTVTIDKAFELFAKVLPGGCIRSNEESTEVAFHDYRLALRALNAGDLAEAERLLRSAIENQDREGGSVHLQGLRYTLYLPHYHLGLALYRQSRAGEPRWDEARRELLASKRQGVIAEDKRHRRLERYLRRCRAALEADKTAP